MNNSKSLQYVMILMVLALVTACSGVPVSTPTPVATSNSLTATSIPPTPMPTSIPPMTIGDIQLQLMTAAKMDRYDKYKPLSDSDIFLVVEANVLSENLDEVRTMDVWVVDENGREAKPGVTITFDTIKKVVWPIAVARSSRSFTLHLPDNHTVTLDSLISSMPDSTSEPVESAAQLPALDILLSGSPAISIPYCREAMAQGLVSGDTYLCISSEDGNYDGSGQTWILKGGEVAFSAYYGGIIDHLLQSDEGLIQVKIGETGEGWHLNFNSDDGQPWRAGIYDNAEKVTFAGNHPPGLDISGHHSGCSKITGRFEILEFVVEGAPATVKRFAANFEQHCTLDETMSLGGYIRFNATVP